MSRQSTVVQVAVTSAPDMERIVVLGDGETFSPLAGAAVYDVQANLTTEETEAALGEGSLVPIIEFCAERVQVDSAGWGAIEEDEGIFVATNGAERVGPYGTRAAAQAEAEKQGQIEAG